MSFLSVYNLPVDVIENEEQVKSQGHFILKTCQRTLVVTSKTPEICLSLRSQMDNIIQGPHAYKFLMEVICGLKSRLLGENEIVSQFKEGFGKYLQQDVRDPVVTLTLQKLFKDAKKIRHDYLSNVGQYSYAGMTKKLITNRQHGPLILIIGSGQLAKDVLKVMNRKFNIHLLARNNEKVDELKDSFSFKHIEWKAFNESSQYQVIINTVGSENIIFGQSFFKTWLLLHGHKGLFIDLGSPSSIDTTYDVTNGVIRLDDIFQMSDQFNKEKKEKIQEAQSGISQLVTNRWDLLKRKIEKDNLRPEHHEQTNINI
jgi:glutamyl-tRNA reductase